MDILAFFTTLFKILFKIFCLPCYLKVLREQDERGIEVRFPAAAAAACRPALGPIHSLLPTGYQGPFLGGKADEM
jgi:hypothetical protein